MFYKWNPYIIKGLEQITTYFTINVNIRLYNMKPHFQVMI